MVSVESVPSVESVVSVGTTRPECSSPKLQRCHSQSPFGEVAILSPERCPPSDQTGIQARYTTRVMPRGMGDAQCSLMPCSGVLGGRRKRWGRGRGRGSVELSLRCRAEAG